nr:hypothetical protein [Tepidiphilus baoligensis]
MARVPGILEQIVQNAHAFCRLDIDGILRRDLLGTVAGDEGEMLDVFVQIGQTELDLAVVQEIIQAEAGKVGHQDVARQIAFG